MMSTCVIDPELPSRSVVELMVSSQSMFGTRSTDLAGTGIFIEGNQRMATDFRTRIVEMRDSAMSIHLLNSSMTYEHLAAKQLYFAYGSNMSEVQINSRMRHVKRVGVGFIPNYDLTFNRIGTYRNGAVASIAVAPGEKVYGVVWQMPTPEFDELDRREDPNAYERIKLNVVMLDGSTHACSVYRAFPQGAFDPDPEYLQLLIAAAKENKLPPDYVSKLESLQRIPSEPVLA